MTKKKNSIIGSFLLRLFLTISLFLALVIGLYFALKAHRTKSLSWTKLKPEKGFNLFTFFGWKWNLILVFCLLIIGICYRYPWASFWETLMQRRRLIDFARGVNMAVISADVGKGKTLLLSILARNLSRGIKKMGFISNVPDAQLLSYNDINFDEPVSEMDSYRLPKYYFLDETNFYIDGVEFYKNRLYHKGVAWLLQISRHHQIRLWISATRDNHVWIAVRQIVNNHIRLGGLKHLMTIFGHSFFTLRVVFFTQSGELEDEFNILVSDLDFALYDSYWLKDTSYFRPREGDFIQPKIADLTPTDQKLINLNQHENDEILADIQQSFPNKQCSEKDWEKNINGFLQDQKNSSSNQKEAVSTNKNPQPVFFQKQPANKSRKSKLKKRKKNVSLQEFMKKRKK